MKEKEIEKLEEEVTTLEEDIRDLTHAFIDKTGFLIREMKVANDDPDSSSVSIKVKSYSKMDIF